MHIIGALTDSGTLTHQQYGAGNQVPSVAAADEMAMMDAPMANTDLINSNTRTSTNLKFEGSGNQANTFAGILTDGPGNGEEPSVLSIEKLNGGT